MNAAREAKPVPCYFISYSRQEVTFADSFSRELEKRGLCNWIDFRNLVPGHAWQEQLEEGIRSAAAVLLVASRASMASASVQDEWRTSLALSKRVILILFEPCKLDPDLAGLEWVDFTGDFEQAITQLAGLLAQPPQEATSLPPQGWIHLPIAARKFMVLSLLLVVMSMIGACFSMMMSPTREYNEGATPFQSLASDMLCVSALFIWFPAVLIFAILPLQFLRRTHNAQTIRNVLVALLAASLLLWITRSYAALAGNFVGKEVSIYSYLCCITPSLLITVVTCVYLNRLLVSKEMYRWSGPTGTLLRITPPDLTGHTANGTAMRVAVEFAPQDRRYAQELKASIVKAGHSCTDDLQEADIVLPLLSAYKTDSVCDPEKTRLIPVLIQSCEVAPRLSRTQWVDLRYGKASMDAVAHLLDEPDELLRILGVLPVRTTILPGAIKWLVILLSLFLNVLLVVCHLVSWGTLLFPANFDVDLEALLILLVPILGLYFLRRYIVHRRIRYLPFLSYWWAVGFTVLLAMAGVYLLRKSGVGWPLWLVPLWMLRKDVRLWLPSPAKSFFRSPQRSSAVPGERA